MRYHPIMMMMAANMSMELIKAHYRQERIERLEGRIKDFKNNLYGALDEDSDEHGD